MTTEAFLLIALSIMPRFFADDSVFDRSRPLMMFAEFRNTLSYGVIIRRMQVLAVECIPSFPYLFPLTYLAVFRRVW